MLKYNLEGEVEMERSTLKKVVEKEVAKKIASYKPFTYFDIEQEIREYLPNATFDRSDVKMICNEIFDDGTFPTWNEDWSKTLCDMNNSDRKVFVLHPHDVDAMSYVDEIDPFVSSPVDVISALNKVEQSINFKND